MSNLITLTCPSCGGRLEVTNDVDRFVCAHCGNAHLIDPGERAESLANEVEILKYNDLIQGLKAEVENLRQQQGQIRQAYEVAEAQLDQYRSKKKSGAFIIGGSLIVGMLGLLIGSFALLLGGFAFIFLGLNDFMADDSEVSANLQNAEREMEDSRSRLEQKQGELAQARMEQTSKRLQSSTRSEVPVR